MKRSNDPTPSADGGETLELRFVDPITAREKLALSRLDWYAAAICMLVLLIAPLVAGDFSTPALLTADSPAEIFGSVGLPFMLLLTAIACVPGLFREWSKPVAIGRITGLAGSAAVLVAWSALSFAQTPARSLSLNALCVLGGAAIIGIWISRLARDRNALDAFLKTLALSGTIVAAVGVREYLQYVAMHITQHRTFSTFSDPNFLAGYLLMTLPLSMALFVSAGNNAKQKALAAVAILLQSACLWLSGSRSGSAMVLIAVILFALFVTLLKPAKEIKKALALAGVLFLVGSVPALSPLLSRLSVKPAATGQGAPAGKELHLTASADAQVNSNEFRRWTWIGTARMARSNPVFGTGIGAYELTYPRYAETAFTIHAHNSYLQLMAETGYPGALAALACLAAAAAFGANAFLLARGRIAEATANAGAAEPAVTEMTNTGILLCGAFAALAGSMLHNLIDSDWYVAANIYTLSATMAILAAAARDIAPLSTSRPAPLSRASMVAIAVAAVALLGRGAQLTSSRMNLAMAHSAVQAASTARATSTEQASAQISAAKEAFSAAAAADPLDPEPHLGLAEVDNSETRLRELLKAASLSPTGKVYYRLGQYHLAQSEWKEAVAAFEHAEASEPKMLQNLRALAGAYFKANNVAAAEETYHRMAHLQTTPYGTVRAMHESVETDFAFAHQGLADLAIARGDAVAALKEYTASADIFAEYWIGRNYLVNLTSRSPAKRKEIADSYEAVLTSMADLQKKAGSPDLAAKSAAELAQIKKDRTEDPAVEQKALHPEGM